MEIREDQRLTYGGRLAGSGPGAAVRLRPSSRTIATQESFATPAPIGAQRGRKMLHEAAVDERWLRWIAGFRFVDVTALMRRFGVRERAARRRVARLLDAGLLVRRRAGRVTIYFVGATGLRLLALPRRKAPRAPLAELAHDLAIARWHAALEVAIEDTRAAAVVLTERGLRERHQAERPCCAYVGVGGGRVAQRWADVAIELPDGRLRAYELEFTAKSASRLRAIVRAYGGDPRFETVTWLVTSPALGQRIAQYIAAESAQHKLAVAPWIDLSDEVADGVRTRVAAASATLPIS